MEILQLRYFCDAAHLQNFSAAAKKYGVPASDISQTISRLEKELGTNLFDRKANRVLLNKKGEMFYTRIKKAIASIDEAKSIVRDHKGEIDGEIKLLIQTNRRLVTQVMERFKKMYPKVTFSLSHSQSDNIDADLVISDRVPSLSKAEKILLVDEKFILAARKGDAALNANGVSELSDQRFITMHPGSSLYKYTVQICREAGFEPNIVIQSDDPYYIRKYVSMGLGIALVPEFSWHGQFENDVQFRDICNVRRKTYVYATSGKYMSETSKKFLELLENMSEKNI